MLKIKNGKLYGKNYSFALPEKFNLVVNTDYMSGEKLEFVADDGITRIEIFFRKESCSAIDDMQEMLEACEFIALGDFVSVRRGKGTGVGLFYKSRGNNEEHYEERYDFKKNKYGETQLDIDISLWSCRKKLTTTIREALETPPLKSFLESITYN